MKAIPLVVLLMGAAAAAQAPAPADARLQQGKQVFDTWCAHCHGAGDRMAGTVALQVKYNGSKPALLEERTDLGPALTKTFVRKGVLTMPPFRKTEIDDQALDAVAAYLARTVRPPAGR